MRFNRKALGARLAVNAVTSTLLGFVVVPLVLLSSPASAYPLPTSQEEYDRYVREASASVDSARASLNIGRQTLLDSVLAVARTQENLQISEQLLSEASTARSVAETEYEISRQERDEAQYNYDTYLIPDNEQQVSAPVSGLRVDIYNQINSAGTPIPPRSTNYNLCKTTTFTHINHNWGGGDIEGCGSEYIMLHYTGYLTVPETTPYGYDFLNIADDGWYMELDGVVVNDNWTLKGCSGWWSDKQHLEAGRSYAIDAWYYEWGGGACSTLYYDNGHNWGPVPASWFTQNAVTPITYVHDPALEAILTQKQVELDEASENLNLANTAYLTASERNEVSHTAYEQALVAQAEAETEIPTLEQAVTDALWVLASIQPYIPVEEPKPTPAPTPTEEPKPEPTSTPEPEPTVEPVPPTTEEVMEELWAEATQDDIVISEELATIPVLGSAIVALADAINFVGNVGADMTPEVREKSEKVVVSAIIVTQIATQAVATATLASTNAGRRN